MFAVPRDKLIRLHAFSGITGKPTMVGYTRADLDRWADFTGGLSMHYGAERPGCAVVPIVERRHRATGATAQGYSRQHPLLDTVLCARAPSCRHELPRIARGNVWTPAPLPPGCDLVHSPVRSSPFKLELLRSIGACARNGLARAPHLAHHRQKFAYGRNPWRTSFASSWLVWLRLQ